MLIKTHKLNKQRINFKYKPYLRIDFNNTFIRRTPTHALLFGIS